MFVLCSTISTNHTKLDLGARKDLILGLKPNVKGYIIYDLESHIIHVSRNVVFYENKFPFIDRIYDNFIGNDVIASALEQSYVFDFDITRPNASSDVFGIDNNIICHQSSDNPIDLIEPVTTDAEQNSNPSIKENLPRRSFRQKTAPAYLKDFQTSFIDESEKKSKYPINVYISLAKLCPSFKQVVLSIDSHEEPGSYDIASQHEHW